MGITIKREAAAALILTCSDGRAADGDGKDEEMDEER